MTIKSLVYTGDFSIKKIQNKLKNICYNYNVLNVCHFFQFNFLLGDDLTPVIKKRSCACRVTVKGYIALNKAYDSNALGIPFNSVKRKSV